MVNIFYSIINHGGLLLEPKIIDKINTVHLRTNLTRTEQKLVGIDLTKTSCSVLAKTKNFKFII